MKANCVRAKRCREGLLGSEHHGNNTRRSRDGCWRAASKHLIDGKPLNKEDHLNQTAQDLGAGLEAARTGPPGLRVRRPTRWRSSFTPAGQARDEEQV